MNLVSSQLHMMVHYFLSINFLVSFNTTLCQSWKYLLEKKNAFLQKTLWYIWDFTFFLRIFQQKHCMEFTWLRLFGDWGLPVNLELIFERGRASNANERARFQAKRSDALRSVAAVNKPSQPSLAAAAQLNVSQLHEKINLTANFWLTLCMKTWKIYES